MGYLSPDYVHDIFISYAHGDYGNDGTSELAAWSQEFAKRLQSEFRVDPKFKQVSVFIDTNKRVEHGLDRTAPPTEALKRSIEGTAVLSILMSPQYAASSWCRDERTWWIGANGQNGEFWSRTFIARIWPTEDAEWPSELRDSRGAPPIGFWWHSREDLGFGTRPFGWGERTDDKNEYTKAILNFVTAIAGRLVEMKARLEERRKVQEEAQRLGAEDGQVLYLYAREAHQQAWQETYDALNNAGYFVTPAQPEPVTDTPQKMRQASQKRIEQLVSCDALLLLGTDDGIALDGDMLSVGRQSRNVGRAQSGKLLPCAVLDRSGGSTATSQRKSAARKLNIEWIDGSSEGWQQRLRGWLQDMRTKLDTAA